LDPIRTVEDQIAEAIRKHENLKRADAVKKARDVLELVGIPAHRGKEYPHQFSGGMKQRVVIAIALSCNPQLLIADEPTTALDVTIQAQVLDMMKKLREKYGMSMLMITHDLGIVADICDEVSIIYAGQVVEHGTLDDVYRHTLHPYTKGLFDSLPNMEDRTANIPRLVLKYFFRFCTSKSGLLSFITCHLALAEAFAVIKMAANIMLLIAIYRNRSLRFAAFCCKVAAWTECTTFREIARIRHPDSAMRKCAPSAAKCRLSFRTRFLHSILECRSVRSLKSRCDCTECTKAVMSARRRPLS